MDIINTTDEIIEINVTEAIVNIVAQTGAYPLPSYVSSVFGRTGNVVALEGDYTLTKIGGVTITSPITGQYLKYNGAEWVNATLDTSTWDAAYNDSIVSAAVTGTTTKTLTLNQQDAGTVTASWTDINTDAVSSVFGRTGAITATSGDYDTTKVTEGTNLYYTEARVNANTNVAANTAARHDAVTIGTANGLSLSTQALSLGLSSSVANGALSGTDWNTFNNKEGAVASGTTAQYYRGDKTFQTLNTSVVPELTNLYFTNGRAQAAITGTAPIVLTSGVVSITQAGGASNGYLSSTDWTTFNAKQDALSGTGFVKIAGTTLSYDNSTYLTTIAGIAAGGELSGTYTNPSLVNSAVTGKVLTGVNITGGTVVDTDTVLSAFGKLQNQINGLMGGDMLKGTWNASTNTPTLTSSVGTAGGYYIVTTAGTTNLNGITDWQVGDWAIFINSIWQKVDNTDAVVSVNGFTGAVSLTTANISEATNLYFTSARAIVAPLTGYTSGAGTVSATDTILGAIQKLNGNVSGLVTGVSSAFGRTGAVVATSGDYITSQVTEGTNLYYTDTRARASNSFVAGSGAYNATTGVITIPTNNNQLTNGASFIALTGLSATAPLVYNNTTGAFTITQAATAANGYLSATDWNTFNNKQATISVTTTGTSGAATLSGTTINIPNYGSALSSYLPLSGGTLSGALSGTSISLRDDSAAIVLNIRRVGTSGVKMQLENIGIDSYGIGMPANSGDLVFYSSNVTERFRLASTGAATFSSSVILGGIIRLKGYTVSTLPAGTQGDTAFVTDALTPTYMVALVGGGSTVARAFYNGTAWTSQ